MKRYFILLAAALAGYASLWAVKASPEPFLYTRADGTTVMARMYGDEFHSYIESLDGELLEGSRSVEAQEQGMKRRQARRIQQGAGNAAFPTKGSPHSLVILVSFSDLDFDQKQQDFADLLNKSGYNYNGATGSCRDYYIASSDSLFSPVFDCYGPYKLSQKMEYYGNNTSTTKSEHANEMVSEACQKAHDAGVNFKKYDTNNDGLLDNVFIFYAGHNEAEGGGAKTVWPHQSNISYMNIRLDGVLLNSYACTSEYKGATGNTRCGVGTFCHEFGHVIGQPDFYDTDYNFYSVSNWDIMCDGSYNNGGNTPPTFSAYERFYEGWLVPKQLELPGQYLLSDVPFHKEAYLIAASKHNLSGMTPDPNEFFMLDYRSGANGWDEYLPGHGMIVWHIDYSAAAWTSNTPNNGPTIMRMHLEEANGVTWKKRSMGEPGRSSDVYPGTNNVTTFTPTLHNGTLLPQPLFNIEEKGDLISFTYISEGGTTLRADRESVELVTSIGDDKKIVEWTPKEFELLGTGLAPDQDIRLNTNSANFFVFAGEEPPARTNYQWRREISIRPEADSTLQQRIWISYIPTKRECDGVGINITVSSVGATTSLPVIGKAPRPTYVHVPEVTATVDITPYSFTAKWLNQADAEEFYITLYSVEEGTTDFKQSFEQFDDYSKIREQGWQSNTNLTTTSDKKDGTRALYLKNYGDQIVSETYPSPVTHLSFWYNAFASTADTIGVLEMEAFNGTAWEMVDHIVMLKKSKSITAEYDFTKEQNYRSFRLTWLDNGERGAAFDAWVATTPEKITYLHKGRDIRLAAFVYGDTIKYTLGDLDPDNTYYFQVQTTDLDKGCEEHLTELSAPVSIHTIPGQPADSKQLTIAYDSINYDPARHAIYVTNPQKGDYLYIYTPDGSNVQAIPVKSETYIYPLDAHRYTAGDLYLVQHAVEGKISGKNKWVKFIFK